MTDSKIKLCGCEGTMSPVAYFKLEDSNRIDKFLVVECEHCEQLFVLEDYPITAV